MFKELPYEYVAIFNKFYSQKYTDVAATKIDPYEHYLRYGRKEGRSAHPYFDTVHYLVSNPDIAAISMDPFFHFIKNGQFENRNPSRFISMKWLNYIFGDDSFLKISKSIEEEKYLSPNGLFDSNWYIEQLGGIKNLNNLTPFEHFLEFGVEEGLDPNPWLDIEMFVKFNRNHPYLKALSSRKESFARIHRMIEDSVFMDINVCFLVKVNKGKYFQITKNIFEKALDEVIAKKQFEIDDENLNWQFLNFINESSRDNFYEFHKFAPSYPPKIIDTYMNKDKSNLSDKYLIYCHWNNQDIIDPWINIALDKFSQQGFQIIFCTNIDVSKVPRSIQRLCFAIFQREDSGFDLESHLLAWESLSSIEIYPELVVLMNDSVVFPVGDTTLLFQSLENKEFDIFGMTKSFEVNEHIQSFFVALNRNTIEKFFNWIKSELSSWTYINKNGLIMGLETQIVNFAKSENLVTKVIYEPKSYSRLNPTHANWKELPAQGVPIIKVDLLRKLITEQPGDTEFLKMLLSEKLPDTTINIESILEYGRKIEISRSN